MSGEVEQYKCRVACYEAGNLVAPFSLVFMHELPGRILEFLSWPVLLLVRIAIGRQRFLFILFQSEKSYDPVPVKFNGNTDCRDRCDQTLDQCAARARINVSVSRQ